MVNVVKIIANSHHKIFDDAILSLADDLKSVGVDCVLTENAIKANRLVVLIGQLWACSNLGDFLPRISQLDYIVLNLEYLDDKEGHLPKLPFYVDLLRGALEVWDYCPSNIDFLRSMGIQNAKLIKFPIRINPQVIDQKQALFDSGKRKVVMLGSYGEGRREVVRRRLASLGVEVQHLFGVYDKERERELSNIVFGLNVHNSNRLKHLEILRFKAYLEAGIIPISEDSDHDPFGGSVPFVLFDDLPELVSRLVHSSNFDLLSFFSSALSAYDLAPGTSVLQLIGNLDLKRLRQIDAINAVIRLKRTQEVGNSGRGLSSLDLGSGPIPQNPFLADHVFGVDIFDDNKSNIRKADLAIDPIPFSNESQDFITAFDFLEHVPRLIYAPTRRNAFVELMNEVYRVLKPGGVFLSATPIYPNTAAFSDPTHVNFLTEESLRNYFCGDHPYAQRYGFAGKFEEIKSLLYRNKIHNYSYLKKLAN